MMLTYSLKVHFKMMLTTQTFHSQYACSELDELQTNFNKVCDLNDELTSRLDVADKLCDIRAKNNKLLKDLLDRGDTNLRSVTCK